MDDRLKQRAVIEFLTKEDCAAVEIHARLRNVSGETVINISNVRRWMRRFQDGETEVAGKARSGRPSTAVDPENRELVDHLIRGNRRINIAEVADELQVSYGSVQAMLVEMDYRKICAKWVPKRLAPDLKDRRVEVCT